MTPIQLPQEIVSLINERIGDEYQAHYLYTCASNWCKDQGYFKAANFYFKESQNELEHAKKLQDFLTDWNCKPTIPQVKTKFDFSGLVDVINKSYEIEYDLYQKYQEASKKIFIKDLATFDFLGWFRDTQRTSVAEFADLLNGLELIDVEDKFQILYFEQTYFNE